MKGFNRVITWFLLITKKYFKDVAFLFTLALIPVLAFSIKAISGGDEAVVRGAMYAKQDASESQKLMDKMAEKKKNAILFYKVDSVEKLKKDVKSGYASSGFELPDDLHREISKYVRGDYKGLQFEKAISKYYYKTENNYTSIACELFFSAIYKDYAREVFFDSMSKREENSNMTEADFKEIDDYYNSYKMDDKMFVFENIDGTIDKSIENNDGFLMLIVRGLIYSLVLLSAMLGALAAMKDEAGGVFGTIAYKIRPLYTGLYVLIPPVFTGIMGLFTMTVLNLHKGFASEIRVMLLYIVLVFFIATAFKLIVKNIIVYATLIPLYVMANVLFCNVFVNISLVFPIVNVIRKVLPLYYALTGF